MRPWMSPQPPLHSIVQPCWGLQCCAAWLNLHGLAWPDLLLYCLADALLLYCFCPKYWWRIIRTKKEKIVKIFYDFLDCWMICLTKQETRVCISKSITHRMITKSICNLFLAIFIWSSYHQEKNQDILIIILAQSPVRVSIVYMYTEIERNIFTVQPQSKW